jgi:O-antigen/teichoic acid export membrane protein
MFKFFAWSTIGSLFTILIQFSYSIVIARIVSPNDFGIAAIPLLIASIGRTVVDSGVGGALIREHRVTKIHYSTVLRFSIITGILISITLCLFSKNVSEFFNEPRMFIALIITASTITVYSIQVPFNAFLIRSLNFRLRTFVLGLSAFFAAIISIYAATIIDKVVALMIYPLINVVFSTVILIVFFNKIIKSKLYSAVILKKYLAFGINTSISAFLLSLVDWTIQSLSYKYFGAAILGNYAQAKKTSDLQLNLAKGNISNVLYSIISKNNSDVISRKNIDFGIGIYLFYVIVISIVLFLSESLVTLFFGYKWIGMVPFFNVLLITSLILFADSMIRMVYKVVDKTKLLLLSDSIKVIFLISIIYLSIFSNLEFVSVLWLLAIGWGMSFLISIYFVRNDLSANFFDLISLLLPVIIIGFIVYLSFSSYLILLFAIAIFIFGLVNNFFKVLYNNLLK